MSELYYAKSKLSNGKQPQVKEHLAAVSKLAGEFGEVFGCREEAELAGLFHDFGKYSTAFQQVLMGERDRIDHAVCGAVMLDYIKNGKRQYRPIMEAINGHHSALLEYAMLKGVIDEIKSSDLEHEGESGKTAALNGNAQYLAANAVFRGDFPEYVPPKLQIFLPMEAEPIDSMLYTRMLFSCLVDADYSVSASDEEDGYVKKTECKNFAAKELLEKLYAYQDSIRKSSNSASGVNEIRNKLFECCGETGEQKSGIFTLTAPTGTGKTLALLHFALRHCAANNKKRIIIVLPFLSIAEQNTEIFQKIVPDILVDHSQSELNEEERQFALRWTAPFIVTTTVKFFEALFASHPTDCRKLHSVANSVIIFDEAQSLPPELIGCTLKAVTQLCRRYNCTMVFSTATQPDFKCIDKNWQPIEIVPDNTEMYEALRRTNIDWHISEPTPLEAIAEAMVQHSNVCTIVNMRRHARKLFETVKEYCNVDGVFFLTTDLCAAHRSEIVAEINRRQKSGLPCRVVATQCIEAGVDLDFDVLYRALAPLDSIIQAAGRCNRNGRQENGGQVTVFIPDEDGKLYPQDWYSNAAEQVRRLSYRHEIDINNPQHIQEYYQLLFKSHRDKPALTEAINKRSFSAVDKEYKLIENKGHHVIVPYSGKLELYERLSKQAEEQGITKALIKEATPITVMTYEKNIEAYAEQLKFNMHGIKDKASSDYYVLRAQLENCYKEDMGLQFPKTNEIPGIL